VPVRTATVSSISDAGVFIAAEHGYFEQEGLAVDLQNVGGGAQTMIPLLGTGQLDVASGGIAPGLFNAAVREVPLKVVADKGSTPGPDWDFVALMVRKDLVDSGRVRNYADLRGLTIGAIGRAAIAEVEVADALERGGLGFGDVDFTVVSLPDMTAALANRAIDVANALEPFVARMERQDIAVRWKGNSEHSGNQQVGVIMYGPSFAGERRELGRRWMIAYVRALRDYNDAFGPRRQGRDRIVEILTKHTAVKDPRDYELMRPAGLDPDGKLAVDSIRQSLAYFEKAGHVRERVDLAAIVDTSFQEEAVRQLGPYAQ
jgi:NitT/TauT family transport system substrate-binding protein